MNQTLLTFLPNVRQSWILNWFWQILCQWLPSFNLKWFCYLYIWSWILCEGKTSFCTELITRKLCRFLLMFSTGFTSLSVLLLPLSLCSVFNAISSNIDEVLSVIPPATVFISGDFTIHHENWLIYSGGIDRHGELCCNFSISNDLTQMVNFPTQILDCGSHSPVLLHLFISSDAGTCSTMAFTPLRNSNHVVVSVSNDFPSNSKWDALFHHLTYDYSCAVRMVLMIVWDILWVGSGWNWCINIPHHRYQVKFHLSPWFLAACAAIVHINHLFIYQQNKSSESKVKLRQANNCCRKVLQATKSA